MEVIHQKSRNIIKSQTFFQGNGELFNASFFLKAQDHFRATKPGAGMNRFFGVNHEYIYTRQKIHSCNFALKGNYLFVQV